MISIIIPCRNEKLFISKCLDSIIANDFPLNLISVLVVDGLSDDGTRQIVKDYIGKFPFIKLLDNPKKITPSALNIGVTNAEGDIIIRMDAHNVYPKNYISGLVSWLEKSEADNVGGVCITCPANDTPKAQAIAIGLSHPFGIGNSYFRIGVDKARWVDTVPFGCYRKDVFKHIGMFDEELVRNQDDEFNYRLIKNGGKILLTPQIKSSYYARDSLGKLWKMYYQYGYFKPLVAKKIGRIVTFRQLVPVLFVFILSVSMICAPWSFGMRILGGSVLFVYISTNIVISVFKGFRENIKTIFWLTIVFPILHFSYGLGFLGGIFNFLLKRKKTVSCAGIPISR